MKFRPSEEVIAEVAAEADTCLVSFSCGKDSIATWLAVRPHFKRIVPFYLYRIPGISFIEDALRYYEDYFGQPIIRLPHPAFYRQLRDGLFQPPHRLQMLLSLDLPEVSYDDINELLVDDQGVDPTRWYCASGVRAADSTMRALAFKRHGAINRKRRMFYPVYDWNKDRLIGCLEDNKVKLPEEYKLFGRSFDGLTYAFLVPIKEHYPEDYRRILEYFPLADLQVQRYEAFLKEQRG